MGANHRIETLEDFARRKANVGVVCACGHRATIDATQLRRLFFVRRWSSTIAQATARLRCRACGRRGSVRVALSYDTATVSVGPRDEAGWRRLAQRLRG